MLMSTSGRPARVHYMMNQLKILSNGDHVVCAASGVRIPIEQLRYWSVARQEPYATAELSLAAHTGG